MEKKTTVIRRRSKAALRPGYYFTRRRVLTGYTFEKLYTQIIYFICHAVYAVLEGVKMTLRRKILQ